MSLDTRFVPKYQRIAQDLRSQIANGQYNLGDQLPTEYILGEQYGVSRQTVRQTIDLLAKEGLVERKQGSGTYVCRFLSSNPSPNMLIAVVTPVFSDYIAPKIIHGLEEELSKNGYTMSLSATHNRVCEERRVLETLMSKSFDGLILEGTRSGFPNPNIDYYQKIRERGVPIVCMHNTYPELSNCVSVVMDNYNVGKSAVERLRDQGHTRIMGVFKSDDMQGQVRYRGFVEAMMENELEFDDDNIFWYTTETKDEFFSSVPKRFLTAINNSTAIVCSSDEFAILTLRYLQKPGSTYLSALEKLAMVSIDRSSYCELIDGDFYSFGFDMKRFGQLAAQKIITLVNGGIAKSEVVKWE